MPPTEMMHDIPYSGWRHAHKPAYYSLSLALCEQSPDFAYLDFGEFRAALSFPAGKPFGMRMRAIELPASNAFRVSVRTVKVPTSKALGMDVRTV
jgi:hypothetical protein